MVMATIRGPESVPPHLAGKDAKIVVVDGTQVTVNDLFGESSFPNSSRRAWPYLQWW